MCRRRGIGLTRVINVAVLFDSDLYFSSFSCLFRGTLVLQHREVSCEVAELPLGDVGPMR